MSKYEIEREEYADGSEKFFILENGVRKNGVLGYPLQYGSVEAARKVVEDIKKAEKARTVVKKEIVE